MSDVQSAGPGSPGPAGVWIDTETGAIVRDEPQHGRLLVVPGDPIPDSVQAQLDAVPTEAAPVEVTPPEKSPGARRAVRKAAV